MGRKRQSLERSSVERFKDTFDNLPEGASIIGFDWRYKYVNKIIANRLGLKPEEVIGKRFTDILHNVENYAVYPFIERCLTKREYGSIEVEVPRRGKGLVFLQFSIQPTREGAFMLSIDRTRGKRAEADLLKSEEEHRSFMDKSPLLVLIYQDGILKYANKSIIDRLGYSFEELSDQSLRPIDKIIALRFRKDDALLSDSRETEVGKIVGSRFRWHNVVGTLCIRVLSDIS